MKDKKINGDMRKTPRGRQAKGEGPDEAEIRGWKYKGKHVPLGGGDGLFKYKDRQGNDKTATRFTLRKKKGE